MLLKAVADTNVIVSGILWKGHSNTLLKLAEDKKLLLFINPAMLKEIKEVLFRPKFLPRIRKLNTSWEEIIESILNLMNLCPDQKIEPVVKKDPDDDKVLSCAVASESKYLISGDSHLLNLSTYLDISIITPHQFLNPIKKSLK